MVDDRAGLGDKGLGRLDRREDGRRSLNCRRFIAVDLLGGEDGGGAGEEAGLGLVAVLGGDSDLLVEDDVSGFLAFADLRAGLGPLLVGAPGSRHVAGSIGGDPEGQDVDATVGVLRGNMAGRMMLPAERCQGRRNSPAPFSIAAMIWLVMCW